MKDTEYIFGANILENLTTGMYPDSKVIYREYIQNSCDQIDKAISMGILAHGEGQIMITLDSNKRAISIEDNATGISSGNFQSTLGDIAYSDKKLGEDKGFRGIGRLCGLAYCKELVFSTTAQGESVISIMRCDAEKMRRLIYENERGLKKTASEVLNSIYRFEQIDGANEQDHWFRVQLIGVNDENTDLLDSHQIIDYLSFVAPVPYQNKFIYRNLIYEHAKELNFKIDEYTIRLNGEQVLKKYGTRFKTSKGEDEIFGIDFKEIYDDNGQLLVWIWIGLSKFKAVISKDTKMRGLRLRKENIQIGDEDALQKLFSEDRGHHYFIGEVFAVSRNLIPNSQRDYFNENPTRLEFENALRKYFNSELKSIYYAGSSINSDYAKITSYEKKNAEVHEKQLKGEYIDENHFKRDCELLNTYKTAAEAATRKLDKRKSTASEDPDSAISRVLYRIDKEHSNLHEPFAKPGVRVKSSEEVPPRVRKLTRLNKREQKLVTRIFNIISGTVDSSTSEKIINKIEEGLK